MAVVNVVLGLALLLVALGVLLAFTDVFLFLNLGAAMFWLGGFLLLIGALIGIVLLVRGALFERRRQPRDRRMT